MRANRAVSDGRRCCTGQPVGKRRQWDSWRAADADRWDLQERASLASGSHNALMGRVANRSGWVSGSGQWGKKNDFGFLFYRFPNSHKQD
jgi:hypothetical protein